MTVSRKKYQEALRVLKGACRNEALPCLLYTSRCV